jgi:hypothetical protein
MSDFSLRRDDWGRLVLIDAGGQEHVGVEPVRCFPITDPHRGIAFVNPRGKEVAWVDALDTLPTATRQLLEQEMALREFMPQLRRVLHISGAVEPTEWEVETDRGKVRFTVNSEDDVRQLSGRRAIIHDSNGIRYLIPDMDALDARSRRLLERYL